MKGLTRVVSYTLTARVEPVYNIEVEGSHPLLPGQRERRTCPQHVNTGKQAVSDSK